MNQSVDTNPDRLVNGDQINWKPYKYTVKNRKGDDGEIILHTGPIDVVIPVHFDRTDGELLQARRCQISFGEGFKSDASYPSMAGPQIDEHNAIEALVEELSYDFSNGSSLLLHRLSTTADIVHQTVNTN